MKDGDYKKVDYNNRCTVCDSKSGYLVDVIYKGVKVCNWQDAVMHEPSQASNLVTLREENRRCAECGAPTRSRWRVRGGFGEHDKT